MIGVGGGVGGVLREGLEGLAIGKSNTRATQFSPVLAATKDVMNEGCSRLDPLDPDARRENALFAVLPARHGGGGGAASAHSTTQVRRTGPQMSDLYHALDFVCTPCADAGGTTRDGCAKCIRVQVRESPLLQS